MICIIPIALGMGLLAKFVATECGFFVGLSVLVFGLGCWAIWAFISNELENE